MKYVGLTDSPTSRRAAHGNPPDWWQREFQIETEARAWEKGMLARPGHTGGAGGPGWRYGYTYTITAATTP